MAAHATQGLIALGVWSPLRGTGSMYFLKVVRRQTSSWFKQDRIDSSGSSANSSAYFQGGWELCCHGVKAVARF